MQHGNEQRAGFVSAPRLMVTFFQAPIRYRVVLAAGVCQRAAGTSVTPPATLTAMLPAPTQTRTAGPPPESNRSDYEPPPRPYLALVAQASGSNLSYLVTPAAASSLSRPHSAEPRSSSTSGAYHQPLGALPSRLSSSGEAWVVGAGSGESNRGGSKAPPYGCFPVLHTISPCCKAIVRILHRRLSAD